MSPRAPWDALAGVLAAAVALAAAEALASALGEQSPVIAVGNLVVDRTPGSVVRTTIDALGTYDKPALIVTIVAIALAAGAGFGVLAGRHTQTAPLGFVIFGGIGLVAALEDPLASTPFALIILLAGSAVGLIVLRMMLTAADEIEASESYPPGAGEPFDDAGRERREFIRLAGVMAALAAAVGVGARELFGPAVDVEGARRQVALPDLGAPTGGAATQTPSATSSPSPASTPVIAAVEQPPGQLSVPGLSPLITPNDHFYRIDNALRVPRVDPGDWSLRITGMVDRELELSFDELLALSMEQEAVTLTCVSNEVGGDLVGTAVWQGVPLTQLFERAGIQPGASQVIGRSVDGFTVGFPTDVIDGARVAMVALGMNGEPLPVRHGFPARLVVAGLYGYVSATKWLDEIELSTLEDFEAYWVRRGWAQQAPIKTQSRIDVPRDGAEAMAGAVQVAGVAWAGKRGVSGVEVAVRRNDEIDEPLPSDAEWQEATLGALLSNSTWRRWVLEWDAEPGDYTIHVRATDGEGDTQTGTARRPFPDGATGWDRVRIRVV